MQFCRIYFVILLLCFIYGTSSLEAQTKKGEVDIQTIQNVLDSINLSLTSDYDSLYLVSSLRDVQKKLSDFFLAEKQVKDNIRDDGVRNSWYKYLLYSAIYHKSIGEGEKCLEGLLNLENEIKESIFLSNNDSSTMRIICNHLTSQYRKEGNQKKADYYELRRTRWDPDNLNNYLYQIYPLINEGELEQAKQAYKKAILQFQKRDLSHYRINIFILHLSMSDIQIADNQLDSAQIYLDLAKAYRSKELEADILKKQGIIARHKKKFKEARRYLNEALVQKKRVTKSVVSQRTWSKFYSELGHVDYDEKKYDSALKNYQSALTHLVLSFNDPTITANPKIESSYADIELLEILSHKINAFYQLKDKIHKEQLLAVGDSAIQLIDIIRSDYIADEDQFLLSKNTRLIYDRVIETAISLDRINLAFYYSEKSKSIAMYDVLRVKQVDYYTNAENDLIARRNSLKKRLRDAQDENNETKILELKMELGEVNRKIKNTPEFQAIFNSMKFTEAEKIRSNLRNDEIFIEFYEAKKQTFAFLIEKDHPNINVQKIIYDDSLDKALRNFNVKVDSNKMSYSNDAHYIYQKIFVDPFPKHFGIGVSPPKKLIIVPDGKLHNIAYDALISEPVEEKSFNNFEEYQFLQNSTSITYWPSASLALNTLYNKPLMKYDYKFYGSAPSFDYLDFKELENVNEITSISHLLKTANDSSIVLAKDGLATKEDFIKFSSKTEIIHLATHGVELSSKESYLVFSLNGDTTQQFKMTIQDIYTLDLNNKLVVLSACDTGIGDLVIGEGMISIGRAFLYAGAESVVSTFWKVEDEVSRKLMVHFYEALKEGKSKDLALQNAKQALIKEGSDKPKWWAAFYIIGNTDAIYDGNTSCLWICLIIVPLLVWWRRKKQNQPAV